MLRLLLFVVVLFVAFLAQRSTGVRLVVSEFFICAVGAAAGSGHVGVWVLWRNSVAVAAHVAKSFPALAPPLLPSRLGLFSPRVLSAPPATPFVWVPCPKPLTPWPFLELLSSSIFLLLLLIVCFL